MMLMGVLVVKNMACCLGPCSLAEWNGTLVRRSDALPDGSRSGDAGLCAWWRSPDIRMCVRRQSRNHANWCGLLQVTLSMQAIAGSSQHAEAS